MVRVAPSWLPLAGVWALAAAGINIESLYAAIGPNGEVQSVLGCSDPEKAEPLMATWGR